MCPKSSKHLSATRLLSHSIIPSTTRAHCSAAVARASSWLSKSMSACAWFQGPTEHPPLVTLPSLAPTNQLTNWEQLGFPPGD